MNVSGQQILVRASRRGQQVLKTAVDERAGRRLQSEARWLRELESVPELEGQVPRVLDEGIDAAGCRYLVLSAVPDALEPQTSAFTRNHASFLASLGKARFRATDFEVSGCCHWLQRGLRRLEADARSRDFAILEQAYHDCETALLYWTGPYVLAQGDFAPRNIRVLDSQLFVVEWGDARSEASPLDDVLHFLLIQRAPLAAAMRRAGEFAREAYPEWAWRPRVIGALTLCYLLGAAVHQPLAPRAYWKWIENRSAWMPA